jgi:hypothetical protein
MALNEGGRHPRRSPDRHCGLSASGRKTAMSCSHGTKLAICVSGRLCYEKIRTYIAVHEMTFRKELSLKFHWYSSIWLLLARLGPSTRPSPGDAV